MYILVEWFFGLIQTIFVFFMCVCFGTSMSESERDKEEESERDKEEESFNYKCQPFCGCEIFQLNVSMYNTQKC